MNPAIGNRRHDASADQAGDDRRAGEEQHRERRRALVGAFLGEAHELLDRPDLRAEHQQVPERDRHEEAGPHGIGVRGAVRQPGEATPCNERSPSGSQPALAGSGRTSHSANGTVPSTKTSPSHGVPASSPRSSSSHLAAGVSRMPPTDSPVDATDNATDRRRWNHRVMTVVVGTIPAPDQPIANTP